MGLSHLTGKGKAIIEAAINIGLRKSPSQFGSVTQNLRTNSAHTPSLLHISTANYPEYLGKCHMINVPWVFTSMWYFIKGLLDE